MDPTESSSRRLEGPGFDLYMPATWQGDNRNSRASGARLGEALKVDPVHLVKVCHVGQKNRCLYDVGEGRALRFEHRLEVGDCLAELRPDTVDELTCLYAKLAGTDDPITRSNGGAIRAGRYGR